MLSRRALRVKAMQTLYAHSQSSDTKVSSLVQQLLQSIDEAYRLYLYNTWVMTKVAQYAQEDKERRSKKHLRTDADKNVDTRIAAHPIITHISENVTLQAAFKNAKVMPFLEKDMIKDLYKAWIRQKAYTKYTQTEKHTEKENQAVLKNYCRNVINSHEGFQAHLEDHFFNFFDDYTMATTAMANNVANYKENVERSIFLNDPKDWNEKVTFAKNLVRKTVENDEELVELIKPQLKNWEIERITQVDIILLKLALCELLHFPTIPVKVTINEYIDISKIYSTPKSKDFINGILDKLMKKLKEEGKIVKTGRGLVGF